jgi:DNA-3-methyladenine glycosylase II
MRFPTLSTSQHLEDAALQLGSRCAVMRRLYKSNGAPPMRRMNTGFKGLVEIIVGQQVSASAADAIWARVSHGIDPFTPEQVLSLDENDMTALGMSRAKVKTAKTLSNEIASGRLNLAKLNRASDDDIFDKLTALHGIGPWTAEIYLLFALRRADAFAPGDLALQVAAQRLFKHDQRLSAKDLAALAERWRPWRAVAARMLWHDYGLNRSAAVRAKPVSE